MHAMTSCWGIQFGLDSSKFCELVKGGLGGYEWPCRIYRNVSRGYTHNGRCSVTGSNTKINPQGNKYSRETGFCISHQIKPWTNRGTTRLEQVWLGNNGVRGTSVAEKHGWSCNQCSKLCREATFSSTQTLHKYGPFSVLI